MAEQKFEFKDIEFLVHRLTSIFLLTYCFVSLYSRNNGITSLKEYLLS